MRADIRYVFNFRTNVFIFIGHLENSQPKALHMMHTSFYKGAC